MPRSIGLSETDFVNRFGEHRFGVVICLPQVSWPCPWLSKVIPTSLGQVLQGLLRTLSELKDLIKTPQLQL